MAKDAVRIAALGALYFGDNPEFFRACLESLAVQTKQLPIFIVVDGPIGAELESVIDEYEELNVSLRRPDNNGLAVALQFGLHELEARFDYVIRFDSDDVNRADRFENDSFVERYYPDLCSAQMHEIDKEGNRFFKTYGADTKL